MNPDLLLGVVAVLAVGCGISLGWVLCEKHRRAHPEGLAKVAAGATAQIEMARMDAEKQIALAKTLYDETKAHLVDELSAWQVYAQNLSRLLASPPPAPKPDSPPEPPRVLNPDQSAARVTGEGLEPDTALRDKLLSAGIPPEKIDAILAGKVDDIPTDELLDRMTDGIIRERTGAL